jgi:S-methylmethionine-dependent homocysteine/selenocysteine methylase
MKRLLPHQTDQKFLVFGGTGTDLLFNRGVELPGFASFPLNEDPVAQTVLVDQMRDLINVAKAAGLGCIIDTATWMANRDRAAPLGYDPGRLAALNRQAVTLMRDLRDEAEAGDILLGLCLGPSRDPYEKLEPMGVEAARDYHRIQIDLIKDMGVDLVNAYTFNQVEEAAGAILAAGDSGLPVALSLVIETDGCLDNGQPVDEAIAQIDALSGQQARYFMINCAHPDHIVPALTGNPRLKGIVVNASRCSHAELNDATDLDDGDPDELGSQVADLVRRYPSLSVLGGCCGTDMRHLKQMAERVVA